MNSYVQFVRHVSLDVVLVCVNISTSAIYSHGHVCVCSYTVRCICTVFLSLRKHQLGAVYMFILLNSLCCHLPVECALEWSIVISLLLPSGSVIDNALTSSNTDNHML